MPRSAIIWTRSRELSLKARYHLTHRMMISWSKCRPLKRSCAEVGSVIPAVIAGYRAFQQFAPDPGGGASLRSLRSGWPRQSVFNLCESPIFFQPPHHNMPEISDREQAPSFAVFDRPSVKGPDLIVRCQLLYHLPERGYKGPTFL